MSANCSVALYIWNPFPLRFKWDPKRVRTTRVQRLFPPQVRTHDTPETRSCQLHLLHRTKQIVGVATPEVKDYLVRCTNSARDVSIALINQKVIITASFPGVQHGQADPRDQEVPQPALVRHRQYRLNHPR